MLSKVRVGTYLLYKYVLTTNRTQSLFFLNLFFINKQLFYMHKSLQLQSIFHISSQSSPGCRRRTKFHFCVIIFKWARCLQHPLYSAQQKLFQYILLYLIAWHVQTRVPTFIFCSLFKYYDVVLYSLLVPSFFIDFFKQKPEFITQTIFL